nr:hypothetical protein [uncultured Albidiferax sp.]
MSKIENTTRPETEQADVEQTTAVKTGLASDAMARRRMLLKSLSKGSSVVAAAAIPMHTLAGTGTLAKTTAGTRCTVSGMASGIHSKDTTSNTCSGSPPSRYSDCANWPGYNATSKTCSNTVGSKTFTENSTFYSVFGCGSSTKLKNVVQTSSSSDECVWVTALLNSIVGMTGTTSTGVKNYPYKPTEVIALCNSKTPPVDFFRKHMQG